MWSYYQYRKIRNSVKEELDKKGKINFGDTRRDDKYGRRRDQKDVEKGHKSENPNEHEDENAERNQVGGQSSASEDAKSEHTQAAKESSESQDYEGDRLHSGEQSSNVQQSKGKDTLPTSLKDSNHSPSRSSDKSLPQEGSERPHSTKEEKPQQHDEEKGDVEDDPRFVVRTFGEDDLFDPRNWPLLKRCKNIAILSLLIFVQAWAGAANSQANSAISKDFHVSQVAENLSTAMYLFGIGAGALFVGPISETVGRNPTYLIGTFVYMLFVLGCATTKNYGGQIVCRFFVGLFSSATLAINGGSVRDQFRPVKRSFVFPVIAWANVAAPVIAPIAGGWIVSDRDITWRWTEWITLIISAFAFLIAFLFLPETHLPTLLSWKAKHLRDLTGDDRYKPAQTEDSLRARLSSVATLPVKFWTTESVIAIFGSYLVLLYVLLFSFLSGFDYIFKETYKLPTEKAGSCFGAIAAGSTVFTLFAPGFYGLARRKTEHIRKRPVTPEFRLWPAIVAAPLLPISLFWLGWTNYPSISIWSGLGACFVFGGCLSAIYVSTYEYIIDSYGEWSSIALASITVVRYLVAGGMVMAARPMYMNIGVHYSLTWLGCVAALLSPAPLIFWWVGAKLREKSSYAKGDDEL